MRVRPNLAEGELQLVGRLVLGEVLHVVRVRVRVRNRVTLTLTLT